MEKNPNNALCPCCMEMHEPQERRVTERNIFQGQEVSYEAGYMYCSAADEYYATEQQMRMNDIAMKDAYRKALGRLTSSEITAIRAKYQISQTDFAKVLGLGEKTVTRYESFQVQTEANDSILRKVGNDPEWYLELLFRAKDNLTETVYEKSRKAAIEFFAEISDKYQRNALASEQARFGGNGIFHGNRALDFGKIVDAINYFASNREVKSLYTVKLMKLLWYADFLCFKRYRHSITGLAYLALPMGAVPAGYQNILELNGICYESEYIADNTGNRFVCDEGYLPRFLTDEEVRVIDTIIQQFGHMSKTALVEHMHAESAFILTHKLDAIAYSFADELSIS